MSARPHAVGGTRNYGQPSASSIAHYRELLANAAADPEPTEADAMACAPTNTEPKTRTPRLPLPRNARECPEFSDAEIGVIVCMRLEGWGVDAIATELGITHVAALVELVHEIEHMSGRTHHGRHRSLSVAEEAEIRRLKYDRKWSVRGIAEKYGRSEGSIRYVLAHPREGM